MAALLAAWGCANIRAPQGGPKDVAPPQVLLSSPENGQTNFAGRSFELTFDEWVQLNDIRGQLVVSPPLKTAPVVTLHKRTVRVAWQEALRDSTTYTFYFGDGVRDFTEANPAHDLSYVFSTGPVLDSLSIAGQVVDVREGGAMEGYKVLAYRQEGDTSALGSQPDYFGRTDKQGRFVMRNMARGAYHLVALEDPNTNYLLDGEEGIAHSTQRIAAAAFDSVATGYILKAYTHPSFEPYIKDYATDSSGLSHLLPALDPKDYTVRQLDGAPEAPLTWLSGDTLHVQLMNPPTQNEVPIEVSWKGQVVDTLDLRHYTRDLRKLKPVFKDRGKVDARDTLRLANATPMVILEETLAYAVVDSSRIPLHYKPDPKDMRKVLFQLPVLDGSAVSLVFPPGCFTNLEGWIQSDTLAQDFFTHGPDHFAQLTVHLNGFSPEVSGFFELVDDKGKVVLTWASSADNALKANRLTPGAYRLRWIEDSNANARWDAGDYRTSTQPERMLYLPETIQARSNWVMDVDWIISP